MKRALGLLILVAAVIAGLFSVRGAMPFVPVLGTSMEPEFNAGDLIMIEEVSPSEVEVGDVIIFTVPPVVREAYNYPQVVIHRVARAYTTDRDTTFRTRGDNVAGEDPFTVRSQDIKGKPGKRIPYLGFPLLYLQSQQGLIFVIVSLCLLTLYLYAEELSRGSGRVQKGLLAPVIEANRSSNHLLEQRIATTEKTMASTGEALGKFASAVEVYAEHLNSHTSAIRGLSEASQELKQGAAEQNKVLARLIKVTEQTAPRREEKARAQAEEKMTAEAEESCQKEVQMAEQQAQYVLKTVGEGAEEIKAAAELISQEELSDPMKVAAEAAAYKEGFGVEGCDLTLTHWWAVYQSQSEEEQCDNNRLPDYLRTCALEAKRLSVVVPREYVLYDVVTGEQPERPDMIRLCRLVAERRIAGVIFPAVNGLSREPLHQQIFEMDAAHYGVQLRYADASNDNNPGS
jgi:signal peptidase I